MWQKVIAKWESGKERTYEVENIEAAIKLSSRLKATSAVVTCKDKLVSCRIKNCYREMGAIEYASKRS